jgi:nitric oxide reductase large subunit
VLGLLVGEVLYGAATLQARVLPRWCGVLFILLMPVTIFLGVVLPGDLAILWVGLAWLALGYVLWSQRGVAGDQPSRVR